MTPLRRRLAALTVAAGIVLPWSAWSRPALAQEPITVDAWVARLDAAAEVARRGIGSPSAGTMEGVRSALGLPVVVGTGVAVVTIDHDDVLDALEGENAADFRAALRHLEALRAAAAGAAPAQPDDAAIRRALSDAYRGLDAEPGLIEKVRRAVGDAIAWLFLRLRGLGSLGPILLVLLAVLALVVILALFRRGRVVPEHAGGRGRGGTARSVDWDAEAAAALAAGDLAAAVRARYRALLAALATKDVVRDAPSTTAGECRAAVHSALPGLDPVVVEATLAFERVAYGGVAPRTDDLEVLRQAEEAARVA